MSDSEVKSDSEASDDVTMASSSPRSPPSHEQVWCEVGRGGWCELQE